MKVASLLVVCLGNICRSPLGAALLTRDLPTVSVTSAGLAPAPGSPVDPHVAQLAQEAGLDLSAHRSQALTSDMVGSADLVLAMDGEVREVIRRRWPHVSGKTFLFDHWTGAAGIIDPYRQSEAVHRATAGAITAASAAWVARLAESTAP